MNDDRAACASGQGPTNDDWAARVRVEGVL